MKMSHRRRETMLGFAFISPWLIGFLIFGIFPIFYSLFLSFNNVTITASGIENVWAGFSNYQTAFTTNMKMIEELLDFLKNNLFMIFIINVFAVLFAILLAGKVKGRGFFRTVFFLPVVVVSGPVMAELLDKKVITMPNIADFSIISVIGTVFGENIQVLISQSFSNLIYMFWFSGVQLIVYLAVLQKMDKSMYEAAQMDGASPWESFWKITLPALKPSILINLIYTLILLATFDNNGVIMAIKSAMFDPQQGFGFASALSWIYFAVLTLIIVILFLVFYGRKEKKIKFKDVSMEFEYNQTRYQRKPGFFTTNKTGKKIKRIIFGRNITDGLLAKLLTYTILIVMAFAFLYPFVYMLFKSIQTPEDVLNPTVGLLPSKIYFGNFTKGFNVLGFPKALGQSVFYSIVPTICQVIASAFVGYGLARFEFKGKKVVFMLIMISFIIPPQILMIPTYVMYSQFELLGSVLTFALPAALGQGLKSTIFILIFFQFFSMIPKELDEAAKIDGASSLKVFFRIAIPLSIPVIIISFIFSFVWYWNETYLTSLYIPDAATLPMQLSKFAESFRKLYETSQGSGIQDSLNEAIYMAGTLISLLPLLILYFLLQRWFVEGVDRAGLTGQ